MKSNTLKYIISVIITLSVWGCEKSPISDDEIQPTIIINKGVSSIPDSIKGILVFHENFQNWNRVGYFSQTKQDCENDLMKSAEVVSYIPTNVIVKYNSIDLNYSVIDFAINPECGNYDGTSNDSSNVSLGYLALQCPIWYTCNHYSKGEIIISSIPSVSYIEFSISYPYSAENNYAEGISLWKKGDGDANTIKVGTYIPTNSQKGERFIVKINSTNVVLTIKAEKNNSLSIATARNINRAVRIHDILVWKPKEVK